MSVAAPGVRPRATILAIGTELTTGQITNRNAAWIAEKLQPFGIDVTIHETVPDERALILDALDRCAKHGDLVFVTGGLGPTQDDFTRDVIAEWIDRPLEFDSSSWDHITTRLSRFGISVAESNRQQCYFPTGSQVLTNQLGTANAFALDRGDARVWILPGPPGEIAAIWNDHIDRELRARLPEIDPLKLLTWQCLGKSEAELGEITEKALAGSGLAIGYRAHRPFVEIKVWCPETQVEAHREWFDRLEAAIGAWVVTRMGEDLATRLIHHLARSEEIEILDAGTGGLLTERLGASLRKPEFAEQARSITSVSLWGESEKPEQRIEEILADADPLTLTLALAGFTAEGVAAIGIQEEDFRKIETIQSPWKIQPETSDRTTRYLLEVALKTWGDWLDQATH